MTKEEILREELLKRGLKYDSMYSSFPVAMEAILLAMELYSQQVAQEKASLAFDAGHDSGQYDAGEFLGERPLDKKEFIKLHFPNQ